MIGFLQIFIFFNLLITSCLGGECQDRCSSLLRDVLSMDICREARKLYPRPRLGNACSDGMEKGYYDACVPMCLGKDTENRIWHACKKVSDELPKPTMAKWCEHGYREGFRAAATKLEGVFGVASASSAGDL